MLDPDKALIIIQHISDEFEGFCKVKGKVSEADTRAKVIDKVLVDVLGWSEQHITRERHVHEGYMDYELGLRERSIITVEAKKAGAPFVFPIQARQRKILKLNGSILTVPEIKEAILQARSYCDNSGIRYAVATNGYAWIIFRAIREDMGWYEGNAIVFPSLEYIEKNFVAFWNLLSYEAVLGGSLDAEFGSSLRVSRESHRVVNILYNSNLPLQRNRLDTQLQPLARFVFEDIYGENQREVLKSCYVYYRSLDTVANDINHAITDTMPMFLKQQGTTPITQSKGDAGTFGRLVQKAFGSSRGEVCLLLGSIGCGKTTFLKRYQLDIGQEILKEHALWFHVDFLEAPQELEHLERFVWQTILEQLRSRYINAQIERRRNIRRAYATEIKILEETGLKRFVKNSTEYDRELSKHLEQWQADILSYVPRLLNTCEPRKNQKLVLFIDNVDQLSPEYQASIFLLAQRITRTIGSLTVIAMREESYYAASVQRSFTAYKNRKFHIASPRFLDVVRHRIEYAQGMVRSAKNGISDDSIVEKPEDKDDVYDLMTIVSESMTANRNIIRFIEPICFGNMRSALEMFVTFLTSGASDVGKMLRIYRRDGNYSIPIHEFVKSIMLGARKYYKEEQSPILNVFDCGVQKNASHFTALRILNLLFSYKLQASTEGQGYVEITKVLNYFEDIFDNNEDCIRTLNRLLRSKLVEINTRSHESIEGASHVRVTSAGWYYYRYLVRSFCYLDLVLQDTPFNDVNVAEHLRDSVYQVDNLSDREEEKLQRMETRFERVSLFLDYLTSEEIVERSRFQLDHIDDVISQPIMEPIKQQYERDRDWIWTRLKENREKYADDRIDDHVEDDEIQSDSPITAEDKEVSEEE